MRVNCIFEKVFNDVNIQLNTRKNTSSHYAVFYLYCKQCNNKFLFEMNVYQQACKTNKTHAWKTHVLRIQVQYSALCS